MISIIGFTCWLWVIKFFFPFFIVYNNRLTLFQYTMSQYICKGLHLKWNLYFINYSQTQKGGSTTEDCHFWQINSICFYLSACPFFLNLYFLAPKYPLAHGSMQILTKSRAIYKYLCTAINLVATIDLPSLKIHLLSKWKEPSFRQLQSN